VQSSFTNKQYTKKQRKVLKPNQQVGCQLPTSADNVALPTFARRCCSAAVADRATIDRYLLPAEPTAANPPRRRAAVGWDRQRDTCRQSPQQQTRGGGVRLSDGTDRETPAGRAHSSKPAAAAFGCRMGQTDRPTDGRTPDSCIDLPRILCEQ